MGRSKNLLPKGLFSHTLAERKNYSPSFEGDRGRAFNWWLTKLDPSPYSACKARTALKDDVKPIKAWTTIKILPSGQQKL